MEHTLPALPYALDALVPHIFKETFEYHYTKHHQAYVTNVNKLIKGAEFERAALEDNSSQAWNHIIFLERHEALRRCGPNQDAGRCHQQEVGQPRRIFGELGFCGAEFRLNSRL